MSTFLEALNGPSKPVGSALDRFPILARIVAQMPEEDRPDVLRALRGDVPASHVADTLTDLGWPVSDSTINTYRRVLRRAEQAQ